MAEPSPNCVLVAYKEYPETFENSEFISEMSSYSSSSDPSKVARLGLGSEVAGDGGRRRGGAAEQVERVEGAVGRRPPRECAGSMGPRGHGAGPGASPSVHT